MHIIIYAKTDLSVGKCVHFIFKATLSIEIVQERGILGRQTAQFHDV